MPGPADGERMGASSGWNLVARRPPRARVAAKRPARHLASVPAGHAAPHAHRDPSGNPASLRVVEQRDADSR